jgi:hypothetical protein
MNHRFCFAGTADVEQETALNTHFFGRVDLKLPAMEKCTAGVQYS